SPFFVRDFPRPVDRDQDGVEPFQVLRSDPVQEQAVCLDDESSSNRIHDVLYGLDAEEGFPSVEFDDRIAVPGQEGFQVRDRILDFPGGSLASSAAVAAEEIAFLGQDDVIVHAYGFARLRAFALKRTPENSAAGVLGDERRWAPCGAAQCCSERTPSRMLYTRSSLSLTLVSWVEITTAASSLPRRARISSTICNPAELSSWLVGSSARTNRGSL